ncbi:hypothetical protein EC973_005529 [Apophysomyces ossiformis]|uniref:Uncharacterized protein n=1 Tax=Apophysomyces ossiformis TaxID=679940 RepID=A0A8H7EL04_9FUNG|nr:hypothetical protein EC973_005529 [Apophysomyces ossiformis]
MNEELFWLGQEDAACDEILFLHADTPVGRGSLSTTISQRRLLKERHRRLLCRIIELQKSEIEAFHADMARKIDPVLLPPSGEGAFEVIEGENYLDAKKQDVIDIVTSTFPVSAEDEYIEKPLSSYNRPETLKYKAELEILYKFGLDRLVEKYEHILMEIRRDYIQDLTKIEQRSHEFPSFSISNPTSSFSSKQLPTASSQFTQLTTTASARIQSLQVSLKEASTVYPLQSSSRDPRLRYQQQSQLQIHRQQESGERFQNLKDLAHSHGTQSTPPTSTTDQSRDILQVRPNKRAFMPSTPPNDAKKPKSILKRTPRSAAEDGIISVIANYKGDGPKVVRMIGGNTEVLGHPKEFDNALYEIATTGGHPTGIKLQSIGGERYFTKRDTGEIIGRASSIIPLLHDFFLETI